MSATPTRSHRNATELAAERVSAEFERDHGGTPYSHGQALGLLDALDWLEGVAPEAPASGRVRDPHELGEVGRELMAAADAQFRFTTRGPRENVAWANGVIRGLKWYLLDPTAGM